MNDVIQYNESLSPLRGARTCFCIILHPEVFALKRLACYVLALLLLLGCLAPCLAVPVSAAQSLTPKKIVSVVVDDSGSMKEFWQSSNYALQAFVSLLNEGDELYITYMSEALNDPYYEAPGVTLSSSNVQEQVNAVRNKAYYVVGMGTPFAALEAAFNRFHTIPTTDADTEYWLVVLTDGEFSRYDEHGNRLGGVTPESLGETLTLYSDATMPNGSELQISFIAIGSEKFLPRFSGAQPQNVTVKLAYENTVSQVISEIANDISGRSGITDIKKVDGDTLRIHTDIPLRNLSALVQNSEAGITGISPEKGNPLRSCRTIQIKPRDSEMADHLNARAYLYDNNGANLPAGTYLIDFDGEIDVADVVVMFEPALELRTTLTLNGQEITDAAALAEAALVGGVLDVSCKVYEMGTDNEIKENKLKDCKISIEVFENEASVRRENSLSLKDYTLTNKETRITASLTIGDFNPITWSTVFTPVAVKYVPQAYIDPDNCRLHVDDVSGNTAVKAIFTVLANGTPVTDPDVVKSLNPVITVEPKGNEGTVSYGSDGTIIFTPNKTALTAEDTAQTVTVSCTLEDKTVSAQYHLLTSDYYVESAIVGGDRIRKNEFFNNTVGATFRLFEDKTRDGVQNGEPLVLTNATAYVTWEDQPKKDYQLKVTQAADGTITCIPYSTVDSHGPRAGWLFNGFHYASLYGKDVTIVLDHQYARQTVTIPVKGASFLPYLLPHVIAPTLLLFIIIGLILAYIIRYITKPRFAKGAVVYVGTITRSGSEQRLNSLEEYDLSSENKFRNLWNPFKPLTAYVGSFVFEAAGRCIKCTSVNWYSRALVPMDKKLSAATPEKLRDEINRLSKPLLLRSIPVPVDTGTTTGSKISPEPSVYYFVAHTTTSLGNAKVMNNGETFCYYIKKEI